MKAANLERIRNNQRRSRARQKEYIAELEESIQRYQSMKSRLPDVTDHHRVIEENARLKKLLHAIGFDEECIGVYLNVCDQTTSDSLAKFRAGTLRAVHKVSCSSPDPLGVCVRRDSLSSVVRTDH